jgi:hypothetical protein
MAKDNQADEQKRARLQLTIECVVAWSTRGRGRTVGKPAAEASVSPAKLASKGIGTWLWVGRGVAMEWCGVQE